MKLQNYQIVKSGKKKNNKEKENKDKDNNNKDEENKDEIIGEITREDDSSDNLMSSTFIQKCFIAIVRFVDIKAYKANEYKIYFNFNQFQKFQKMEKYIDKVSFLIKFIDINHVKKIVTIDYKRLDNFDENEWIKDFNKYNTHYLQTIESKTTNMLDYRRTTAEYSGMTKNSLIQIEIYTPISLARTLNDSGNIKTDKTFFNNNYLDQANCVEKDNILELSKIFYNSYEEEQNKK